MIIQNFKRYLVLAAAALLVGATTATAQPADETHVEPDRPDVTNGTRIVPAGIVQVEFGGLYTRDTPQQTFGSSPFTARVGLTDWFEARIGGDGVISEQIGGVRATGMGNVQVGAKLRLWASPGGAPVLSILPVVNLPVADSARGLGSGQSDYTIAVLTGTDFLTRGHIDVNYGIGAIGGGEDRGHFPQHLLSASLSEALTDRINPYVEVFWFSRTDIDGTSQTAIDGGLIYELGSHFALDGGVQFGVAGPASDVGVFGGLSILLGGERALNGRERKVKVPKPRRR